MAETVSDQKKCKKIKIHVVGDAAVNWYTVDLPADYRDKAPNWTTKQGWGKFIQAGGALLTQEILECIFDAKTKSQNLISIEKISGYQQFFPKDNKLLENDGIVQRLLQYRFELQKCYDYSNDTQERIEVFGVKKRAGFHSPSKGPLHLDELPEILKEYKNCHSPDYEALEGDILLKHVKDLLKNSLRSPQPGSEDIQHFLLINDDGNYFRYLDSATIQRSMDVLQDEPERPIEKYETIFVKMRKPYANNNLIQILKNARERGDNKKVPRVIIVVSADDLRDSGLDISREISWDNTLRDVYSLLISNSKMKDLIELATDLVITFKREGACHINELNTMRATFDHRMIEGEYGIAHSRDSDIHTVDMPDLSNAFFTALASSIILNSHHEHLDEAIKAALSAVRNVCDHGLHKNGKKPQMNSETEFLTYPSEIIKNAILNPDKIDNISSHRVRCPPLDGASIFMSEKKESFFKIATDVLINGHRFLTNVPISKFHKLVSADNKEIESYRSIFKVLKYYMIDENWKNPLSIAVFGPPGSGKSFGVEQMAQAANIENSKTLQFNLAQFDSINDLVDAFHIIVDVIQKEKFPIVFFDEFDSPFNNEQLGWLKYFLAPMQDGQFKDKQRMATIGRSIFVFAGGTASSYDEFCPAESDGKFIAAKGPDFISRLDGHLDILGPNRNKSEAKGDDTYLLRRALLIRSLLKRVAGRHKIFRPNQHGGTGELQIEPSVAYAMLRVREYKHGARSIETILRMSGLNSKSERFSQSNLPTNKQLRMHLDTESFRKALREYQEDGAVIDESLTMQFSKRC